MKKMQADGTVTYRQSWTAFSVISSLIITGIALLIVPIGPGQMPERSAFAAILIAGPGILMIGLLWRQALKNRLWVSADQVVWRTNRINVADIESVDIKEETFRAGTVEGEQPILIFIVRGMGEVRCKEIGWFFDAPDEQQLKEVKAEIEKRMAAINRPEDEGNGDPGVEG